MNLLNLDKQITCFVKCACAPLRFFLSARGGAIRERRSLGQRIEKYFAASSARHAGKTCAYYFVLALGVGPHLERSPRSMTVDAVASNARRTGAATRPRRMHDASTPVAILGATRRRRVGPQTPACREETRTIYRLILSRLGLESYLVYSRGDAPIDGAW